MLNKGCKKQKLFKLLYKTLIKKGVMIKYYIQHDVISTQYIINSFINS